MTEPANETIFSKLAVAWISGGIGAFTLSQWVLLSSLLFTIMSMFFMLRDKWWRERPDWRAKHGNPRDRRTPR